MNSYFSLPTLYIVEKLSTLKLVVTYKIKSFTFFSARSNLSNLLLHQANIFHLIFKISFKKLKNNKTTRHLYRFKILKKKNLVSKITIKSRKIATPIFFQNNYIIYVFYNRTRMYLFQILSYYSNISLFIKKTSIVFLDIYKRITGEGFFYIRGLFIIFFIDASVTDDEPL
jgi:hypothetical protein